MWGHMVWMALRYLDEGRIKAITLSQWIKGFVSFRKTRNTDARSTPGIWDRRGNVPSESRQINVSDETRTSGRETGR